MIGRLHKLRSDAGLNLGQAARATGFRLSQISEWERGVGKPTADQIDALSKTYGCSTEEIIAALPTDEEIAEQIGFIASTFERLDKALAVVHADAKARGYKQGNGGQGSVACPCCESGTLRYSVASLNGHVWGSCTTADCVRWMQ